MTITRNILIAALVGLIAGLLIGFCVGKGIYDQPSETKIERDTVVVTDTIRHYYPAPVDGTQVRTEYKWLTAVKHDTINQFREVTKMIKDTVLVEVPIESKHYNAPEYDAWVSGYMPSLDSINVYNRVEYITETITKAKKRSRWSIGVQAGYGYGFRSKQLEPYAGLGIGYNF